LQETHLQKINFNRCHGQDDVVDAHEIIEFHSAVGGEGLKNGQIDNILRNAKIVLT
jgi:hypothetical protein